MIVSRETRERLEIYHALLKKWNSQINLVSQRDMADFHTRHVLDCWQIAELSISMIGKWADFGSGGGLPGLVLAIAKSEEGSHFTLIESDKRKAAFLRTVVRETDLNNCVVVSERIEVIPVLGANYITARALASLKKLLAYLDRHMAAGGTAFFMKGRQWQNELHDARLEWQFDCVAHPSRTDASAAILEVKRVSHGAA